MRTFGSNGETTEKLLREAGVRLIAVHGYEAVSLRLLAKEVGIQAGSLYNYITNKQDFLFSLLAEVIADVNADMEAALAGLTDPRERLERFIKVHMEFHTGRQDEVFIGNMELRSLTPENLEKIVLLRNEYEDRLKEIIEQGVTDGIFSCNNPKIARLALMTMLTGVSNWYRATGPYSIDEIIAEYTKLSFALLGYQKP